jgi:hypothetical protein
MIAFLMILSKVPLAHTTDSFGIAAPIAPRQNLFKKPLLQI